MERAGTMLRIYQPYSIIQCIFGRPISVRFRALQHVWKLIRRVALWQMWLARNAKVFKRVTWSEEEIKRRIWKGTLNYGRIAWERTKKEMSRTNIVEKQASILKRFDARWTRRGVIYHQVDIVVRWQLCILLMLVSHAR